MGKLVQSRTLFRATHLQDGETEEEWLEIRHIGNMQISVAIEMDNHINN